MVFSVGRVNLGSTTPYIISLIEFPMWLSSTGNLGEIYVSVTEKNIQFNYYGTKVLLSDVFKSFLLGMNII